MRAQNVVERAEFFTTAEGKLTFEVLSSNRAGHYLVSATKKMSRVQIMMHLHPRNSDKNNLFDAAIFYYKSQGVML